MFTCHLLLLIITLCVVLQTGPAFWWQPGLRLREGKREGAGEHSGMSGVEWSGVEWSGVKGECKMGSVSCIFWLKAQDAAPKQTDPGLKTSRLMQLMVDYKSSWRRTLVQKIPNQIMLRMCWLVSSTKAWFNAAECWWQMENSCRERRVIPPPLNQQWIAPTNKYCLCC